MAGESKTKAFNIGTATVMIGPMADVEKFTPEKHSIGLVKNFSATSADTYTDLTQGIQNKKVWSEKTGTENSATMEVYEYSAANLAYALGLDGSKLLESATYPVKATSAGTITISAGSDIVSKIAVDSYLSFQSAEKEDRVYVGKVMAVSFTGGGVPEVALAGTVAELITEFNKQLAPKASLAITGGFLQLVSNSSVYVNKFSTVMQDAFGLVDGVGSVTGTVAVTNATVLNTLTGMVDSTDLEIEVDGSESNLVMKTTPQPIQEPSYAVDLYDAVPEDMKLKEGDFVRIVNMIPAGTDKAQPFFGAKVVGILPDGKTPVTVIYPKVRITAGFTLGFTSDSYSNMPFELTPFDLVEGDANYEKFKDKGFMVVYK